MVAPPLATGEADALLQTAAASEMAPMTPLPFPPLSPVSAHSLVPAAAQLASAAAQLITAAQAPPATAVPQVSMALGSLEGALLSPEDLLARVHAAEAMNAPRTKELAPRTDLASRARARVCDEMTPTQLAALAIAAESKTKRSSRTKRFEWLRDVLASSLRAILRLNINLSLHQWAGLLALLKYAAPVLGPAASGVLLELLARARDQLLWLARYATDAVRRMVAKLLAMLAAWLSRDADGAAGAGRHVPARKRGLRGRQ